MANGRRMPSTTTTVLVGSDDAALVDDRDRVEAAEATAGGARDARWVEAEGEIETAARVAARRAAERNDIMILRIEKVNDVRLQQWIWLAGV